MRTSSFLFERIQVQPSEPRNRAAAASHTTDDAPNEVRHVQRYSQFVSFIEARGSEQTIWHRNRRGEPDSSMREYPRTERAGRLQHRQGFFSAT